jgi:hypothetical protein
VTTRCPLPLGRQTDENRHFEYFMALSIYCVVFRIVTPCGTVRGYKRFWRRYFLFLQGGTGTEEEPVVSIFIESNLFLKMKASVSFETLLNIYLSKYIMLWIRRPKSEKNDENIPLQSSDYIKVSGSDGVIVTSGVYMYL